MTDFSLRMLESPADLEIQKRVISKYLPEVPDICSNFIRSGIIYLLVNSPQTGHSLKVENMAYRLGIHHRLVLYHLEKLMERDLVEVKKSISSGKKEKRSIWGLNLNYPNWIYEIYQYIIHNIFSEEELKDLCGKNTCRRTKMISQIAK